MLSTDSVENPVQSSPNPAWRLARVSVRNRKAAAGWSRA